jgi:hypothetical protein
MAQIDTHWAERFAALAAEDVPMTPKRMFGGLCFLLHGHMVGGVGCGDDGAHVFMFRVGKGNTAAAEALPGGAPVVLGGRRMGGMFHVNAEDTPEASLEDWMALAVSNARSLPPK